MLYQQTKLTEINLSVNDIQMNQASGILWNPETDTFHIKYTLKSVLATKRGILSLKSSIFDPLGLIAPALMEPKWITQQLWKRKIDWESYTTFAKMARQSTRHTQYHLRQMVRISGH